MVGGRVLTQWRAFASTKDSNLFRGQVIQHQHIFLPFRMNRVFYLPSAAYTMVWRAVQSQTNVYAPPGLSPRSAKHQGNSYSWELRDRTGVGELCNPVRNVGGWQRAIFTPSVLSSPGCSTASSSSRYGTSYILQKYLSPITSCS